MEGRRLVYFVSDVHLGLKQGDPEEREARFLGFLKGIDTARTRALCLLGDIWDFWYEYRDVIPKCGFKVLARLSAMMDEGVEVYFVPGNHDLWAYGFLKTIGIRQVEQPLLLEFGGSRFCLGHGHGLGPTPFGYRLMLGVFRCRFLQVLFSSLHPWLAFRFGLGWSGSNRKAHEPYVWKGSEEALWKYSEALYRKTPADWFIYGHFHVPVRETLPCGATLVVLDDWLDGGTPHAVFDGEELKMVP
jgi:UDP-2,3-diacylglucosamine hydrolase